MGERIAVFVEVAEQRMPSVDKNAGTIGVGAEETRNVIVNQLRSRRVVADEARRDTDCSFLLEMERS